MKKCFFILLLLTGRISAGFGQVLTVKDLLNVSSLSIRDADEYMYKNGYYREFDNDPTDTFIIYIPRKKNKEKKIETGQTLAIIQKADFRYFILHGLTYDQFIDGVKTLKKMNFFYNKKLGENESSLTLFQKNNLTVQPATEVLDSVQLYKFTLRQQRIPDSVRFAEDLLTFGSQEFLSSYFGRKNVTNDLFYFSEDQLKKSSVLFSNSDYQALFVWGDENNLNNLSYIIIANEIPSKGGERTGVPDGNNAWKFKNGIRVGMSLSDVLALNGSDFNIYGRNSKLAFMADPDNKGRIDFRQTAVMFSCSNCFDNNLLNQNEVSAKDLVKANLHLKIFDIIIYPGN
jgi:hypothetical protein